jgi:hypothetical protein
MRYSTDSIPIEGGFLYQCMGWVPTQHCEGIYWFVMIISAESQQRANGLYVLSTYHPYTGWMVVHLCRKVDMRPWFAGPGPGLNVLMHPELLLHSTVGICYILNNFFPTIEMIIVACCESSEKPETQRARKTT